MRDSAFLRHYLNTVESIGFIVCFIIFIATIYHIHFQNIPRLTSATVTTQSNLSTSTTSSSSSCRQKIDPKIKRLAIPSILFYALSCITDIFSRGSIAPNWAHIWFISTQCAYIIASDLSHLLFICQLYIVYNQNYTIYAVSKTVYIILFILVGIFTFAMLTKAALIIGLENEYIAAHQYAHIGATTVCVSAVADLLITVAVLYLFHSRLSFTIKQLQSQSHLFGERLKNNLITVRLKQTILTTFALVSSQLYLIMWTITVWIWYKYEGENKDQYVYDSTIVTLTLRSSACITNSMAIFLNFKFSQRYYTKSCRCCILCYYKMKDDSFQQQDYYPLIQK